MTAPKLTPEQITRFCVLCLTGAHIRAQHQQDIIDNEPEDCVCLCVGCRSGACQLCDLEHGIAHDEPIPPVDR